MEGFELFRQGAEGRIFKGVYLGKPAIAKERFVKKYRHPDLDSHLTKERIKSESRSIIRCKSAGIRTPALYLVDFNRRTIFMEYFENSIVVKDFIAQASNEVISKLALKIGAVLGKMHANSIIHGDLTTSNMLLVNKNGQKSYSNLQDLELIFIDFGLSHVESSAEDKGVDLYVLERALISTHSTASEIFDQVLEGYKLENKSGFKEVLAKFKEVQARGRKRTMVG
ncbi:EKC/KEOPS complex subunit TP53RK [Tribolium castaneum]|uniref:non-specific serine/threonine protein kinase n=1 Tax=Tribolium castaneum TaxID=7070 RepID=D6WFA1_TRICA|nr:PREDICTED: TP53-regulating kinase [Tribolium castaneum]EFA00476.1 TP53-regulating kinase-like Protein [Tribolium castaneum]|eukprot:XP_008190670.1 PREDICTED: TP53-regulating kinase [Tribolium castaneum]